MDEQVREITAMCDIENTGSISLLTSLKFERKDIEQNMFKWSLIRNKIPHHF